MKKIYPPSKWLALLFTCLLLSIAAQDVAAAESLKPDTVTLDITAGTLHERIGSNKKLKIECLRLTGQLNIDDIQFIREMAGCYYDANGHKYDGHLRYLDISGAMLTGSDVAKEVPIYSRDLSEYEGTPLPSSDAYIDSKGKPVAIFAYLYGMEEIVLPSKLESMGDDMFIFCRSLKSLDIPESVREIGLRAFLGCSSLKSMELPWRIEKVMSGLFSGCTSLTSVTMYNNVTEIWHNAFRNCTSLKSIELPSYLSSMGISVFYGCTALTHVTIPSCMKYIGDYTFYGCTSLTSVDIPLSVTKIDDQAFYGCTALSGLDIPHTVTEIGAEAFSGCRRLTALAIPSGIVSIGEKAFKDCGALTTLYALGAEPITINANTFENVSKCTLLVPQGSRQEYWLKDGWGDLSRVSEFAPEALVTGQVSVHVQTAGTLGSMLDSTLDCFRKYRIQSLKVTGSLNSDDIRVIKQISGCHDSGTYERYDGRLQQLDLSGATLPADGWNLETCRFTSVVLPQHITAIPDYAFAECNELASILIPQGVTSIGYNAFGNCGELASVTLPAGLTRISGGAFFSCTSFTSLTIPSRVKSIESRAFAQCWHLTSLTLQEGITDIHEEAFAGCDLLTTLTLPSTVETICGAAFDCKSLSAIYALNPHGIGIKDKPFSENTQYCCTLYVPKGSMQDYTNWEEWAAFRNIVEFDPAGIDGTHATDGRHEVGRYSVGGSRLASPAKGLNIVRYSDGTTRKVMK